MKYYRFENKVYAFEDNESQGGHIVDGMVLMTDDEVDQHINPDKYMTDEEKAQLSRQSFPRLTKRKFQLYMLNHGLLDDVENTIDSIEDPIQKRRMQIEYSSSDDFERLSPAVSYIAYLLGWSDAQIDQMWEQALTL